MGLDVTPNPTLAQPCPLLQAQRPAPGHCRDQRLTHSPQAGDPPPASTWNERQTHTCVAHPGGSPAASTSECAPRKTAMITYMLQRIESQGP